jgi:hypothetical protein
MGCCACHVAPESALQTEIAWPTKQVAACTAVFTLCFGLSLLGYGRVLPHESIKLLAIFQPPIPGVQYFDLVCRTLAGRVFRLEGKANGLQPGVSLSHNIIKVSLVLSAESDCVGCHVGTATGCLGMGGTHTVSGMVLDSAGKPAIPNAQPKGLGKGCQGAAC